MKFLECMKGPHGLKKWSNIRCNNQCRQFKAADSDKIPPEILEADGPEICKLCIRSTIVEVR